MAQISKLALMAAFDGETADAPAALIDLEIPAVDNAYMRPYWELVDALLVGVEAMRLGSERWLPKLPAENDDDYKFRVSVSKLTNVFRDIVEDLSSRPFAEEVKLNDVTPEIEEFAKNVDGAGTSMTMFAAETFFNSVAYCLDWIFIDFPNVIPNPDGRPRTREDDQREKIRPYWSHVRAINVLEVRTAFVGGSQALIYIRLFEPANDGKPDRVRIMERNGNVAVWSLYEQDGTDEQRRRKWVRVDQGVFSIGEIPMVPFATARRNGRSWQFYPAMKDAAELQVQLYQDESALKHSTIMSAFVMIAANGVKPEYTGTGANKKIVPIKAGPGRMLFGGSDGKGNAGSFELLEPSAATLEFQAKNNAQTIANLRELGRQPLTAQSGNLTVITTTVAAMKGNSACQQWAIMESVALSEAIRITGLWMQVDATEVRAEVFHDFDVDAEGKDMSLLNDMRKNGDLSQETLWDEASRRGILAADFDPDEEKERLLAETPADEFDDEITDPTDPGKVVPIKKPVKPPIVA